MLAFRPPRATDASSLWHLSPARDETERDSCYAYLLLCTHFPDTSLVAADGDQVVGFALGYRPPLMPQHLFVRELGIAEALRGGELGVRLLDELLARPACADARFLCMTCAPDDATLRTWFERLARTRHAGCTESPCFPAALFAEPHRPEHLLRVGPLS